MDPMHTIKAFIARLAGAPLLPAHVHAEHDRSPGRRRPAPFGLHAATEARASRRTARQRAGDEGEDFARRYLERAGLLFVAGQVGYRDGELDLVMRDATRPSPQGSTLVFVEVRRRAGASHGGAAGSITREKRRRVVAAASHYLVGLGLRSLPPCRFDVLTLEGDAQRGFCVEWIRDAFRDEG